MLAKSLHGIMGLSNGCSGKGRLLKGRGCGYNGSGDQKWPCVWPRWPEKGILAFVREEKRLWAFGLA